MKRLRLGTIYDRQRTGKMAFIAVSVVAIVIFLIISNNLVKSLAAQERERMDIWAQATENLAQADMETDVEFLLNIIAQNTSIPVMVADSTFEIIDYRNFRLPDNTDTVGTPVPLLSERNYTFLVERLKRTVVDTHLE